MKILHCADLHLDSPFSSRFSAEEARVQRAQLLQTFLEMIRWAGSSNVSAVLLCGDIFDTEGVSETTLRTVESAILRSRGIHFFYLCGNHDPRCPLFETGQVPANFHVFRKQWTSFTLKDPESGAPVRITGMSFSGRPLASLIPELSLPPSGINIVLLHGMIADGASTGQDPSVTIPLPLLRGKGIDYLALGHIHAPGEGRIDARGVFVNPGCLQGRGFDECGPRGFVLIEISSERGLTHRFVPFARSVLYSLQTECTGCFDTLEIAERMRAVLLGSGCAGQDIVKMTLTGELRPDLIPDTALLQREGEHLCSRFYLSDETRCEIHAGDYLRDISLKGEFVRTVMADQALTDEMKGRIIRRGLQELLQ